MVFAVLQENLSTLRALGNCNFKPARQGFPIRSIPGNH